MAKLLTRPSKRSRVTPLLISLHESPVQHRTQSKVLVCMVMYVYVFFFTFTCTTTMTVRATDKRLFSIKSRFKKLKVASFADILRLPFHLQRLKTHPFRMALRLFNSLDLFYYYYYKLTLVWFRLRLVLFWCETPCELYFEKCYSKKIKFTESFLSRHGSDLVKYNSEQVISYLL